MLSQSRGPSLPAHRWGGVVIGEAGNDPRVSALAYVAAYALDRGESLKKLSEGAAPTPGQNSLRPDARGFLSINPAALPTVFGTEAAVAAWHEAVVAAFPRQGTALPTRQFLRGDLRLALARLSPSSLRALRDLCWREEVCRNLS